MLPGRHLSVLRDVTERRELERELWRAQRLESVGRLAGGVAHDFNNMLTAIRGYAQLLLARVEPGSVEQHHAQEIDMRSRSRGCATAQLLAFGRRQVLQARSVDLNRLARGARRHARRRIAGDHARGWSSSSTRTSGRVRVDPAQIEQVLVNLVANAADAMRRSGGRIVVRTANADVHRRRRAATCRTAATPSSSGRGLRRRARRGDDRASVRAVLHDEGRRRGVGLGLASAYGIAKQSGGTIDRRQRSRRGSTFSVYLPARRGSRHGKGDANTRLGVLRRHDSPYGEMWCLGAFGVIRMTKLRT